MYNGNYIQASDAVVEKDKPKVNLEQAINRLVDRVFTDVYLCVGVPAGGLGVVGDKAINVSTWIPYKKTAAATWTAQTAIDNNANAFMLISSK